MTTQPTLFGHASTRTAQPRLFDDDGPHESGLSCECGEPMVRTQSGFLCCPRGCGKLREDVTDQGGESGSWFNTDEEE